MDRFKVGGRLEQATLDELSPGEVILKAEFSSVDYTDALGAPGVGAVIRTFPLIAGIDVAGRVTASEGPRFTEGDAVLVTGDDFGSRMMVATRGWCAYPQNGSSLSRRNVHVSGHGDRHGRVHRRAVRAATGRERPAAGQGTVRRDGGTGGVGMIAIDILSGLGYDVLALTGKLSRESELKALGASGVLDSWQRCAGGAAAGSAGHRWEVSPAPGPDDDSRELLFLVGQSDFLRECP